MNTLLFWYLITFIINLIFVLVYVTISVLSAIQRDVRKGTITSMLLVLFILTPFTAPIFTIAAVVTYLSQWQYSFIEVMDRVIEILDYD